MIPLPAAIAKHLRPNATLLVVPIPPLADPQGRTFVYHDGRVWASLLEGELIALEGCMPCTIHGGPAVILNGDWCSPVVIGRGKRGMGNPLTCPLTPGETYTAPDGSTYRVATVECRRVRSVTEAEAKDYGCDCRSDLAWGRYGAHGATMYDTAVAHGYRAHFEETFTATHGAAAWDEDAWSWFITREAALAKAAN